MARKVARFINLMLTGNEFGSIIAVHPAVASLPPPTNIAASKPSPPATARSCPSSWW